MFLNSLWVQTSFQNFWQVRVSWEINIYPFFLLIFTWVQTANFHRRLGSTLFFFLNFTFMQDWVHGFWFSNILSCKVDLQCKFHSSTLFNIPDASICFILGVILLAIYSYLSPSETE